MYWRNIIPVFLVHAFNVKSVSCIVNYLMISNIHNRTLKSDILFTYLCIRDFFNRHDLMKHWVQVFNSIDALKIINALLLKIIINRLGTNSSLEIKIGSFISSVTAFAFLMSFYLNKFSILAVEHMHFQMSFYLNKFSILGV